MKWICCLFGSLLLLIIAACNSGDRQVNGKPENDIDAARDFIRAALDGKFGEAKSYMFPDSTNFNYLAVAERNYQKAGSDIKQGYMGASINIHSVNPVNDSTTIIIFSNSFKNDHDTLKALKVGGQWLIDLKYLYEHDMDTTRFGNMTRDTLP